MATHQLVSVVQFGPAQQVETDGINHDAGWAALDDQVVGLGLLVEFEAVLEATAAPGQYGHAKGGLSGLLCLGHDLGNARGSAIGNGELFHAV